MGYKGHARPTPYLGGAAVMLGFLAAAATFAKDSEAVWLIAAGAALCWLVGTIDDRRTVGAGLRVLVETVMASALWVAGHGWDVFGSAPLDLTLTVVWVVGLVNAFNLMDNMDGTAGSVASVSAAGAGVLALIDDQLGLACIAFALSGACIGFLPYNLRSPSRIFLGDGGSMPIGFVVSATVMGVAREGDLGFPALMAAIAIVALPILDTSLVVISRRRRGISILTGGRDHTTHRLRTRLPSARAVAMTLAAVQALLCIAAIAAAQIGSPTLVAFFAVLIVLGASAIGLLETPLWVPGGRVAQTREVAPRSAEVEAESPSSSAELILIAAIGLGAGLSAFAQSYYLLSVWGPIALVFAALLLAVAIGGRAPRLSLPMTAAVGSLALLWAWSLLSNLWAESVDSAMVDSARWLLYLSVFALLALALRGARAARIALGAVTAGAVVVALYMAARMLTGDGSPLFLGTRLNGPLGYVNGQASALLLGFWPLVALAERHRNAAARGAALALATLVAGLVVLTQTRAIVPALGLSVLVMVVVVPGRERRLWALAVIGVAFAIAAQPVLDVYRSATAAGAVHEDVIADAARALLIASVLAGAVWAVISQAASARLLTERPGFVRASRIGVVVVTVLALCVAIAAVGNPVTRVRDEARAFVELKGSSGTSRFLTGGGNRYDYWRVAVHQLRDNPVAGVGAGNFDRTYFLERKTTEDVKQAHSIELQVLGELGVVGGLALALFISVILMSLGRMARVASRDPARIGLVVAAGGMFVTWLAHASVDW